MRKLIATTMLCFGLTCLATAHDAAAAIRRSTQIPAQGLGPALQAFAQERELQVLYFSKTVRGMRTTGASGELTTEEALSQLLNGTGLTYRYINEKAVTILPAGGPDGALPATSDDPNDASALAREGAKSASRGFRLAQVGQGADSRSAAPDNSVTLQEVIVTAQKREERLQDVPVPVTVLGGADLSDRNQVRLQDYYSSVPGLNLTTHENGGADVVIRGITTGGTSSPINPTVGFVIDDVPFGSSTALGGGRYFPDIDPSELQRVEVLRGPQGTLYGASSLGGLLKMVTVDPSTDEFSGRVQVDFNDVSHGDGPGYGGRVAVNIPISDTFALRASGFGRRDTGYIDNVENNKRGVNWASAGGGRLSALWRPTDTFSLKLSALSQTLDLHGYGMVDLGIGLADLKQSNFPGTGANHTGIQAYSAIAKAQFGEVDLTFLSGYNVNSDINNYDATPLFSGLTQEFFGFTGTPFIFGNKTKKFTEELRLEMPLTDTITWLVGGFYTHESSQNSLLVRVADDAGQIVDTFGLQDGTSKYQEIAAFTNLTVNFTDRFDTQFGVRQSKIAQRNEDLVTGLFALVLEGEDPKYYPPLDIDANAFTYLVTPRFKVSPDLMLYGRFSSGFRPGGPNSNYLASGVSDHFDPDKTRNYELGVKGAVGDGALSFDLSAYYIDWKNIQISLAAPNSNINFYTDNAGFAKSQGVELSLDSRLAGGFLLSGWAIYNDAVLTKDFPDGRGLYGLSGDRLPNSSRVSANLSLRREFPLGVATAFAGVTASYVGERIGLFGNATPEDPTPARQVYPAYTKTDLDLGAKYADWTFTLYGNNITDRRGLNTGGLGFNNPFEFGYIQPRTVGLSVSKAL